MRMSACEGKSQTQTMCTILLGERGWKLERLGGGLVLSFFSFRYEIATDFYKKLNILTILNEYKNVS